MEKLKVQSSSNQSKKSSQAFWLSPCWVYQYYTQSPRNKNLSFIQNNLTSLKKKKKADLHAGNSMHCLNCIFMVQSFSTDNNFSAAMTLVQ